MSSCYLGLGISEDENFRYYLENGPGLSVKMIRSDGNCLYGALAYHLFGDEENWPEVRRRIAFEIYLNPGRYEDYLTDKPLNYLVTEIMRPGQWGGELKLSAAASHFEVNIVVIQSNGYYPVFPHGAPYASTIYVSYHSGCHYNALVTAGK